VPPFVLTVLKIALLVILYFFVWRAVRAILADLYGGTRRERRAAGRQAPATRQVRRGKGTPTKVVVIDERGSKAGTYKLGKTLQIGRGQSSDIRLTDTYVSTAHARITNRNGAWMVEDLGSTNGTYLNQRRVTAPAALAPGDRIRVGKTTLELRR
jgi:pSer/pThr/pTyr-binding forkhead associated (FHA) protein